MCPSCGIAARFRGPGSGRAGSTALLVACSRRPLMSSKGQLRTGGPGLAACDQAQHTAEQDRGRLGDLAAPAGLVPERRHPYRGRIVGHRVHDAEHVGVALGGDRAKMQPKAPGRSSMRSGYSDSYLNDSWTLVR
jgi:hypothetical protein